MKTKSFLQSLQGIWRRLALLVFPLYFCVAPITSTCQQSTPASAQVSSSLQPLSIPHLYWHFLVHVNELDMKAAQLETLGNDGSNLRNDLQVRLGFSDADFAPIRASSQRLVAEVTSIRQQMATLQLSNQSTSPSAAQISQVKVLIGQREQCISQEMAALAQSLTPQKRAALEAFMAQFLAPKSLVKRPSSSASQPAGQAGTQ